MFRGNIYLIPKNFCINMLRPCPSCKKEIDENAKFCPHCETDDPFGKMARKIRLAFLFFIGLVIVVLVYASYFLTNQL